MADESSREHPEFHHPDLSKPAPSIWDVFARGRINSPRDIASEVRSEMGDTDSIVEGASAEKATDRPIIDSFRQLFNSECDEYGRLILGNIDIEVTMDEVDKWGDLRSPKQMKKYRPHSLNIGVGSSEAKQKDQEEMRVITMNGQRIPEFFLSNGKVMKAISFYEMAYDEGVIQKESLIREVLDVHIPKGRRISDQVNIDKLSEFELPDNLKAMMNRGETKEKLEAGDYELLKAILTTHENGGLQVVPFPSD